MKRDAATTGEFPGSETVSTTPDGQTVENEAKAGQAQWTERVRHLPENAGTEPFELVLVELK